MGSKINIRDYPNISGVNVCVGSVGIEYPNGASRHVYITETTTSTIIDIVGYVIHVNKANGEIKKVVLGSLREDAVYTKQKYIKRELDKIEAAINGVTIIFRLGKIL